MTWSCHITSRSLFLTITFSMGDGKSRACSHLGRVGRKGPPMNY